jgi:hypothetical protein
MRISPLECVADRECVSKPPRGHAQQGPGKKGAEPCRGFSQVGQSGPMRSAKAPWATAFARRLNSLHRAACPCRRSPKRGTHPHCERIETSKGRVAPAITRRGPLGSGRGDFHHPALPWLRLAVAQTQICTMIRGLGRGCLLSRSSKLSQFSRPRWLRRPSHFCHARAACQCRDAKHFRFPLTPK